MAKNCEHELLSTTLKQFHSRLRTEVKLCTYHNFVHVYVMQKDKLTNMNRN